MARLSVREVPLGAFQLYDVRKNFSSKAAMSPNIGFLHNSSISLVRSPLLYSIVMFLLISMKRKTAGNLFHTFKKVSLLQTL